MDIVRGKANAKSSYRKTNTYRVNDMPLPIILNIQELLLDDGAIHLDAAQLGRLFLDQPLRDQRRILHEHNLRAPVGAQTDEAVERLHGFSIT